MGSNRRASAAVRWTCRAFAGVIAASVVACGSGTGRLKAHGDYAQTSSGGDRATEAAIRQDGDFACPDHAGASVGLAAPAAGRRLRVATTVAPITSIVASVAGDRAEVRGVIPEGTDSHTYEPKPSVAAIFAGADIVFVNGLSLETPTKNLARANLPRGSQIVDLGSTVLTPDQYIYDFSFPRRGGKPNPHLWTNPPMAGCYAAVIGRVLSRADPANAEYYEYNAAAFEAAIGDLDRRFRAASEAMPASSRVLLTYHDAYAYFAAHYRWKVIGAIQVSSFEEPTPKEVASLIGQVKRERVPAIFGSEVFPSAVLAEIGKEARVKYVDTLRDDDLPGRPGDPDHSYLALMRADFVTIVSSLGGDARGLAAFPVVGPVQDAAEYPQ